MAKVLDLFGSTKSKRREPGREEFHLQCAVMVWAGLNEKRYPELALLHHIPNGGHRYINVAMGLKKAGVKAGVPDLCLPVARNDYHGLYLEIKAAKGALSRPQKWWHERLLAEGYSVAIARDLNAAISVFKNYLEDKP